MESLLDTGTSPDDFNDPVFGSALHHAAQRGDVPMTSVLLTKGRANVDARITTSKATPLMVAAVNGHVVVMDLLYLRHGANIRARDSDGDTVLRVPRRGAPGCSALITGGGAAATYVDISLPARGGPR